MIDLGAEREQLFVWQGQRATLKPGVTREQAERFYARLNAVKAAERTKYRSGSTVKDTVDFAISTGHIEFSRDGRWGYLKRDESSIIRFSSVVEHDYISTALGLGKFAKNY